MNIKQTTAPKVTPLCSFIALALIVTLGCFTEAAAQWTTTGTDITNSNTGNVGVGKSTPTHKLDVLSSIGAIARFDSSASAHTQVLINSASGFNANLVLQRAGLAKWSIANIAFNDRIIFLNSSSAEVFSVLQNGNVGINTASPSEKLVTVGNILGGNITNHTQLYSSYDTQAPMIMELGYGTATADITPYASLVLSKNLTSTNNLLGAISFANSSIANGNEKRLSNIASWTDGATNNGMLTFATSSSGTLTERIRISANGNVGIGTTTPGSRLEVVGTSTWVARFKKTDNNNGGIMVDTATGFNPNYSLSVNGVNKWHILNNSSSSDVLQFWEATGAFPRFTLTQAGSVGIGIGTPGFRLDVQGGQINSSGGLCIGGDCKTAWSQVGGTSQWTTSGTTINYGTGNVGIGTATPTQKLEVSGNAIINTVYGSSATAGVLSLQSTSHATKGTIQIGVDQTTTTSIAQSGTPGNKLLVATDRLIVNNGGVRINGAPDNGDLSITKLNISNTDAVQFRSTSPQIRSDGTLLFTANNLNTDNVKFTVQNSSVSNAFVVDSTTATPAKLFDVRNLGTSKFTIAGNGNVQVVGDVAVTGNISAKYQDMAEWVESSQELDPGTVVVLDRTKSNQVIASSEAYDTRVAGVISKQPGIILGEQAENKFLVATTGRVRIKVDATSGPIQIGDLLVTSDKAGFAMKSMTIDVGGARIHRPGTLIGKALEPLANGTGEILVLLSMQ